MTRQLRRFTTHPNARHHHIKQDICHKNLQEIYSGFSLMRSHPQSFCHSPTVLADKAHDKVKSFCKKMLKQKGSVNGFYNFYPMSHDYNEYAKTYISAKFVNMINSNNGSRRCVFRRPREQRFFPGSTSALRTFPWSEWQRWHLGYQQASHRASEEA